MKIRIYFPFYPFPITDGASQIVGDQIRTFIKLGHKVDLVLILETQESFHKKFQQASLEEKALPVQIHLLEKQRPDFTFFRKLIRVSRSLFSSLASPELYFYPPTLRKKAIPESVDLAIYHYSFAYSWLKQGLIQNEKQTVVFFHNLESDLFRLRANIGTSNPILKFIHRLNFRKLKKHEYLLSQICDEIWFVSPIDQRNYIKRHFAQYSQSNLGSTSTIQLGLPQTDAQTDPIQKQLAVFRYTPPSYPHYLYLKRIEYFQLNKSIHSQIVRLGLIGNFQFEPNLDSAKWVLNHLAPRLLEKRFQGQILFIGQNPPASILNLAKQFPFVSFLGFVENIEPFWSQISFMLVPHISGSGVRMKLLEALASGVPVLANSEAIERIHPNIQKSPLLHRCNQIDHWIDKIMKEEPFQTRNACTHHPMISELLGEYIYHFLSIQL